MGRPQSPPSAPNSVSLSQDPEPPSSPTLSPSSSSTLQPTASPGKADPFLDITQPLFPQLLNSTFSKQTYLTQVHKPRYYRSPTSGRTGSAPLFTNPFIELLSKTPWWVVPLVWGPPVIYFLATSAARLAIHTAYGATQNSSATPEELQSGAYEADLPRSAAGYGLAGLLYIFGLAAWTLIEYILHRGLFHVDDLLPEHPYAYTAHFVLHGIHHFMPLDPLRLVMPPVMTIVLATPFYLLTHFLTRLMFLASESGMGVVGSVGNGVEEEVVTAVARCVFSGIMSGYIVYDLTHYFLHHVRMEGYYGELKRYHLDHHYRDHNNGFGVSQRIWDKVFGTELGVVSGKEEKQTKPALDEKYGLR